MKDPEKRAWLILQTLFDLARVDRAAEPGVVADLLGIPEAEIRTLIRLLDAQGLMCAERCRLTMTGLVLAASHDGWQRMKTLVQAA